MIVTCLALFVVPVKAGPRRHIDFAAQDRLNAGRLCRLVKIDHAVHDAVIGHRERCLSQLLRALNELRNFSRAVEQRILRVYVQVCKCH